MGEQTDKTEATATDPAIVVGKKAYRRIHVARWLRFSLLGVFFVVIIGLAGAWAYYLRLKPVSPAVAQQHNLQTSITDVNAIGDTAKLKANSSKLIQGAADGTYNVSNADLAKAYTARGGVELNSGNYKAAVADYQKAVQLDPSQKELVSYGEFLARYHLGERKTLIPLLQSLEAPLKDNHEPGAPEQLDLYQNYITDLQAGKDLVL